MADSAAVGGHAGEQALPVGDEAIDAEALLRGAASRLAPTLRQVDVRGKLAHHRHQAFGPGFQPAVDAVALGSSR